MKTTSAEHGKNIGRRAEHGKNMICPCSAFLPMFCACTFHVNSMNNLLSYCVLIDAKIRASDKDLPVLINEKVKTHFVFLQKYLPAYKVESLGISELMPF